MARAGTIQRSMATDGFVSAGYVVVRRIARPAYLDGFADCDAVVSASDYLVPVLPSVPNGWIEALDTPPGRFSGFADAAQGNLLWALEADLARFGLDGTLSAAVSEFLSVAFARGDFYPPSAFATPEAAQRFVRVFGPLPPDAHLVGLAVRAADVDALTAADDERGFMSRLPQCHEAPADGGEVLGFDVYRIEDGELHPWLREERARDVVATLRGPRSCCLMDSEESAVRAASALTESGGAWFAWRLARYPLKAR